MEKKEEQKIRIRKAKIEDTKKISRLIRNTILKINSKHYPQKQMQFELSCYTPSKIKEYLEEKIIFCLLKEDKIIGVSMLNLNDRTIESLYLNPKFIGKGLGKKMLSYLECFAKKKNIDEITLYPTEYALNFYKNAGYKIKRKFKGTSNGGYPVIDMRKKLK